MEHQEAAVSIQRPKQILLTHSTKIGYVTQTSKLELPENSWEIKLIYLKEEQGSEIWRCINNILKTLDYVLPAGG